MTRQIATRPLAERILEKCVPSGNCLIWRGARMSDNGTPSIHYKGGNKNVRVAMWMEMGRRLPKGWTVRAKCGEESCVAPECLELHNYRAYPKSVVAKVAIAKAMRARSRLTEEAIADIRAEEVSPSVLAQRHGVSHKTVLDIQTWHTWAPLTTPFSDLLRIAA